MSKENNDSTEPVRMVIISYVPEIARYNRNKLKEIGDRVERSFINAADRYGKQIEAVNIYQRNRSLVIRELKSLAKYLETSDRKGIIYYFGHGDQVRDVSGDEIDGKDEIWRTQNILDDEISIIFNTIHDRSMLTLISDSCSSGSMIDTYYNKRNWVTISSSNDVQDSLSTADGGVFTLFGLIPALENVTKHTPREIHRYIKENIDIPTQTSLLNYGNIKGVNQNIF